MDSSAAVEEDLDVGVAGGPDIAEELCALLSVSGARASRSSSRAWRSGARHCLVEARLAAVASAVGAPALDAVDAAPGGVFDDFAFVFGRKLLKEAGVVGQLDGLVFFEQAERVGERHFAVLVMMTVGFAVGGDVDQLRAGSRL